MGLFTRKNKHKAGSDAGSTPSSSPRIGYILTSNKTSSSVAGNATFSGDQVQSHDRQLTQPSHASSSGRDGYSHVQSNTPDRAQETGPIHQSGDQSHNRLRVNTQGLSPLQPALSTQQQHQNPRASFDSTIATHQIRRQIDSTFTSDRAGSGSLPPRTLDRFKLLGAGTSSSSSKTASSPTLLSPSYASNAGGSTVSLPAQHHSSHYAQQQSASYSVEQFDSRPSMSSVRGSDYAQPGVPPLAPEKKSSRWKLGLGGGNAKRRSASSNSVLGSQQPPSRSPGDPVATPRSPSIADDQNSGFFVRSFRTVSRVQQDPISTGPYESLRPQTTITTSSIATNAGAPQSPPLPALPALSSPLQPTRSRPSFDFADSPRSNASIALRPQAQHRSSSGSGSAYGHNASSSYSGDRAPSPSTISVEAFRLATNSRTKSTVSLASLVDSPASLGLGASTGDCDVSGTSSTRPRFEPSKSRRSSFRSDLGGEGIGSSPSSSSLNHLALAPPRPSFAAHSRSSSAGSITASSPVSSSPASSTSQRRVSVTAFPSSGTAAGSENTTTAGMFRRPSHSRRSVSSSDAELRLISMYGSQASPLEEKPSFLTTSPLEKQHQQMRRRSDDLTARTVSTSPERLNRPAWAIQPPTPNAGRMRTTSAMAAPQTNNVQAGKSLDWKGKQKSVITAWNVESSEDEADDVAGDGSDSDDEVPLAQIQSRSQTDLRLPSPSTPSGGMQPLTTFRSRSSVETAQSGGGRSSEQEILADPSSPGASGRFSFDTMSTASSPWQQRSVYASSGASTLGRGPAPPKSAMRPMSDRTIAQRRSVSTLSFSNQLSGANVAAAVSSQTSSSTPTQPPSLASLSMHPRSHSTPGSPMSIGVTASIAPPPLEYLPTSAPSIVHQPPIITAAATASSPRVLSSASSSKDYSPAVSDLGMRSAGSSGSTGASSLLGGSNGSGTVPTNSTSSMNKGSAVTETATRSSAQTRSSAGVSTGFEDDVKRSVKFADDSNTARDSMGSDNQYSNPHQSRFPGKRASSMPIGASGVTSQRSSLSPPVQSSNNAHSNIRSSQQFQPSGPTHRASMSSFTPSHEQKPSNASTARTLVNEQQPKHAQSQSISVLSGAPGTGIAAGGVFDRMKARHKAEALDAIRIGKELNGTALDGANEDDDEEDEDEPLASLPVRQRGSQTALSMYGMPANMAMMGGYPAGPGSIYGGGGPASPMSQAGFHQQQQQQFYAPQSSFGGYSPLAMAPPGVDPYLYASLPNDQKMQLHQRSQQMMQMMAAAAFQAKAESEAGWDTSSNLSGDTNARGSTQSHVRGSMSMGSLSTFAQAPLASPYMFNGMGVHAPSPEAMYQQQFMPPAAGDGGGRLPPFAPSLAMSQAMFQPSFYGYAGSAIGAGGGYSGSALGTGTAGARQPGKRASSVMGSGARQQF